MAGRLLPNDGRQVCHDAAELRRLRQSLLVETELFTLSLEHVLDAEEFSY
jgi:hypothetical protein